MMLQRFLTVVVLGCTLFAGRLDAQEHWVVTWAGASQAYGAPPFWQFGNPPQDALMATGILEDQTLRTMVRTTIGGSQVRVRLTNRNGNVPLRIGSARVGLLPARADEPDGETILQGTDRRLLFGGASSVTIPQGQTITSDPVDLAVPRAANFTLTLYLPDRTPPATTHYSGIGFSHVSVRGDYSGDSATRKGFRFGTVPWLSAVEVLGPQSASAIVVLTDNTNDVSRNGWWDRLAVRLSEGNTAVVAIGDNRASFAINTPFPPISDRLDGDVLNLSGVRWIVLRPFLPEILSRFLPWNTSIKVTPEGIAQAHRQIVEKAHAAGVKVAGGTITPFPGWSTYSADGEAMRQSINSWIRTSGIFDALIDFDRIVRDPERPEKFLPRYRTEQEVSPHPNMADAIDLSIFENTNRKE